MVDIFFLEREGVRCQVDLRWLLTSQCGTGDLHVEIAAVPPCHDNIKRVLKPYPENFRKVNRKFDICR